MKKNIKFLLLFFGLLVLAVNETTAQVFMGGNRVISQFTPASLDEYRGYGAVFQRQIDIKESNFSLTPTFQLSLLSDKQYTEFLPEFYTSISIGMQLNYDVFSAKKFKITPFAGPSFIWVTGLQSGAFLFEPQPVNFYRLGLEVGLAFTYIHSEKFSVKLLPLTYTWGVNEFVQGSMLSLLFQIN